MSVVCARRLLVVVVIRWVLCGFSVLMGGDPLTDMLGIGVGHLYYFLEDVYPRMLPGRPRLLKTPRFIDALFRVPPPHVPAPVPFPNVVPPPPGAAAAAAPADDAGLRDDPVPAAVIPDAIAAPGDA